MLEIHYILRHVTDLLKACKPSETLPCLLDCYTIKQGKQGELTALDNLLTCLLVGSTDLLSRRDSTMPPVSVDRISMARTDH